MSAADIRQLVVAYRPGLEAEMTVLRQLQRLALAQAEATDANDLERLVTVADERERLMAALVEIEHELRPIRRRLADQLDQAADVEGFRDVVDLHRAAADLVSTILRSDQETVRALKDAEVARRFLAQTLETGETTLAAYRRVLAPRLAGSALLNRRG